MESAYQTNCIREYRKYADTVIILSAMYEMFQRNRELGKYIGIETKLKTKEGAEVEPDLVALYDNETKGILFEIKWSLPDRADLLQSEIEELLKYFQTFNNWRNATGKVSHQDLVLVCHIDDVKKVTNMINMLELKPELSFLQSTHFSICSWTITPSKKGEREEELRIFNVYGKTSNDVFEELVSSPGGLLIPKRILQFLRFKFFFIKQKPPPQYTIVTLIQHILSGFPEDPGENSYEVSTDIIYERASIFFPSWRFYDRKTIQLKRKWIREALNLMAELKIISRSVSEWWKIPKPIFRKRRDIQEALCKEISKLKEKQGKKGTRRPRRTLAKSKPSDTGPLDRYFQKTKKTR